MAYTVKQVAKLSGISVRTLHHYDAIGLLKPSYIGDNGYRYYGLTELACLQQIMFYRELDLPLADISRIMASDETARLTALESHRAILRTGLERHQRLLKSIDNTIAHLKGETTVKLEDIFEGFTPEKQAHYEEFLKQYGVEEDVLEASRAKTKDWKHADWLQHKASMDALHADVIQAIEKGLAPESKEVQKLMERHYRYTCQFWVPDARSYAGLADLYGSHPDFITFYEALHPKILGYLQGAIRHYAQTVLS